MDAKTCDAYYGTGEPFPNGAAVCKRPEGHPSYAEDGIGHSPHPTKEDQNRERSAS